MRLKVDIQGLNGCIYDIDIKKWALRQAKLTRRPDTMQTAVLEHLFAQMMDPTIMQISTGLWRWSTLNLFILVWWLYFDPNMSFAYAQIVERLLLMADSLPTYGCMLMRHGLSDALLIYHEQPNWLILLQIMKEHNFIRSAIDFLWLLCVKTDA